MDRDGFTEYVEACWPQLVRTAVLMGCEPAEAEDIVQETLLRCLKRWARVRQADDRQAYVHRVLINTFISARRRRWTQEQPTTVFPELPTNDDTAKVDIADAVLRSLSRLPEDQRVAVVLRYYAQLSERSMAAALGVAPGTIKSRLSRGLKVLAADTTLAELKGSP